MTVYSVAWLPVWRSRPIRHRSWATTFYATSTNVCVWN